MVVNDNAGRQGDRGVAEFIASKLAPTGGAQEKSGLCADQKEGQKKAPRRVLFFSLKSKRD